ncbi:sensor histidine kinase [Luteococcus peritonei]|uniref:Sensor histidine kinase n=1 Tax=Luteococcus peritonei TaxID=88874 RepID=A0ABW4RV85_9ACTN
MTSFPAVTTPAVPAQPDEPAPAAAPGARSWLGAVQECLRWVGLATVPLLAVLSLQDLAGTPPVLREPGRWGHLLLLATLALTTLALLLRLRSRLVLVVELAGLLGTMALLVPHRDLFHPSDLYCPGWWSIPVLAHAMAVLEPREYRRYLLPAVPLAVAIELMGPLFFWRMTPLLAVDEVFVVQPPVLLFLFGRGLGTMAREHDRANERIQQLRSVHTAQRAEHEGRREAARILHDHVLHALHAIGEDRELVASEQAVRECRDTLEQLDRPDGRPRAVWLHEELEDDPVLQRLAGRVQGRSPQLPAAVATTIAAATHEALVNVERHAQARRTTVRLDAWGEDGCRVVVSDDGRGFDTSRQARGRLGIRHSLLERMDDIGGQAEVTSAPGEGTVVTLLWPQAGPAVRAPRLADHSAAATRRILVACAWPGMVSTACMTALLAPQLPGSGPLVALTVLCLAIGVWNALRLPDRGLSLPAVALMLGVALAAWFVNIMTVPQQPASMYFFWMAWGLTPMVQLAMHSRSNPVAMAMGLALPLLMVVSLVGRFGTGYTSEHLVGSVAATSMIVVVIYAAMLLAQRIAAHAERQQRRVERARDATARLRHVASIEQFWSDRVTQDALPMIRAVAAGELSAADDQVRTTARSMESSVRDELLLGPGHHGFSEHLARLRSEGWQVQSSLSHQDGPASLETATLLALCLGRPVRPGQMVTLSSGGGAVTAVVLEASAEQTRNWNHRMHDIGGHMDHDPDFVRLAVTTR